MHVPEHYRFPIPWFDPRHGAAPGGPGAGEAGQSGIRYSALDVAETACGRRLPTASSKRLSDREVRAITHHRRLYALAKDLDLALED